MKRKRLKSKRIGRIRKEGRLWRERVVLTYAGLMTSSHTFFVVLEPFSLAAQPGASHYPFFF